MPTVIPPKDIPLTIKFGGGLHTRASADEIDAREAADGQNFILDLDNRELRNRPPFDYVGTLPNAASVNGGGSLIKSDGTIAACFQGGANVYSWNGAGTFTKIGTCNSASKLRGDWRRHNWGLTNKVLFTDLTLTDTVKEWDGTTFKSVTFLKKDTSAFGSFYAKYLSITNELAMFANVRDGSGLLPQVIVGSKQSDYTTISSTDAPSSTLNTSDPFFLTSPDLRPINGLIQAFGTAIFSTDKGSLFNLAGTSAKDYSIDGFSDFAAAVGDESLEWVGTDIIYGRAGRIESVRDTNTFGNSSADDLTYQIADVIAAYKGWSIAYNSRTNLVYLFPTNQSQILVFNNAMRTSRQISQNVLGQWVEQSEVQKRVGSLSPWMRYSTAHSLAFQPTMVMSMLDPSDGLEYIFMGDASGNIYRMEGTGAFGDGGSSSIQTTWTSKVFSAPLNSQAFDVEGYIKYKKDQAFTATITILAQGKTAFDQAITVTVPAVSNVNYWGGSNYWGETKYWGASFQNRLIRQSFQPPGQMEDFQVKIDVTGTTNFAINEIGLRFKVASQ